MSNLSEHVERAAHRVKQFDEDPRMAVSIATEAVGLSKEQRERVLERVQDQATPPVTDGSGNMYAVDDPGVPAGEGESWAEAAERLRDGERCPACGAEGDLEKTLAPGQRRCPTPTEQCAVVTFRDGSGA